MEFLFRAVALLLTAANFLWYSPRMLADTAAMGTDYLRLSHDLPKIPQKQMQTDIASAVKQLQHPFILANKAEFERARTELEKK
ncbi:MAG: hypothetical protein GX848_03465, partial [Clostridiales bacterium]|nr:hypothetical protein [Clostridiales bacterium]